MAEMGKETCDTTATPHSTKVVAGAWSIQPSSREEGGYSEQSKEGFRCQGDGEEGRGTMHEEGAEVGGVEGCEEGVGSVLAVERDALALAVEREALAVERENRSEEGSDAELWVCMMENEVAQDPLFKDIGVKYLLFHGRDEEWPGWSYDSKTK